MKVGLWILQGALAAVFAVAGIMKLLQSQPDYAEEMAWAEHFTPVTLNILGAAEVLGAIGLIIPAVTRIVPVLAPIAAAGLAGIMAGAVIIHIARDEWGQIALPAALLIACAFVAGVRFGRYAIHPRIPAA